ncbi:MAG: SMP-30/gluconolactonase/LRE family protein [Gemmatimonadaceae bacterium]|nr:SMP-30/gluconolactonase/LRE family protein [Gemmatimonadaceae bacterium]
MRPAIRFTVLVALAGCSRGGEAPATDSVVLRPLSAALTSEAGGFRSPESARYDPDLDVFYISNMDGDPFEKDGRASIVIVPAESLSVMRVLAEGGRVGVTLNAPKGMTLIGDTLWVADIDVVRGFHRRTGAPVATIDLAGHGARFLNDLATGPQGALYVTDTGLEPGGRMAAGRIFRISVRTVTEVARGEAFRGANGIAWQDTTGKWLLAPASGTAVKTWVEGDSLPADLVTGPGQYDGIEALRDGRILVSSWADSAVHLITHGTMSTLIAGVSGPADIGYDLRRGVVAVPRLLEGKVSFFQLKAGP